MSKNKKPTPTMSEIKDTVTNLINHQFSMSQFLNRLDATLAAYIVYNKNGKEFKEWLQEQMNKQMEETNESVGENSGKSSGGDRKTKIKSIKSTKKRKSS